MDSEKIDATIKLLMSLNDAELIVVLQKTFASKSPYPLEASSMKNHFFLGIAKTDLLDSVSDGEDWSEWANLAVAYPDPETYPTGREKPRFSEFGECLKCHIQLASNAKVGICPICGHKNNLT